MHHYIIIYLKLTETIKRYKRFWTGCKNRKSDSLKFLSGNREWRQNRWITFILGHQRWLWLPAHFRSTSDNPNSWLELPKIYLSQTRTGKHRKWTRDDFGLGKDDHDQSRIITRERDLKTIKKFWIDFFIISGFRFAFRKI